MQDDLRETDQSPPPGTRLDPYLTVLRVVECIAVTPRLLNAMGFSLPETTIAFTFGWTGLSGRQLEVWSNRAYGSPISGTCHDMDVVADVDMPADATGPALVDFAQAVLAKLFLHFDGAELDVSYTGQIAERLIARTWA